MTINELKAICKARNLSGYHKMRKSELLDFVISTTPTDELICELTCEVPEVELELYHISTERGFISIWSECESAEEFLNSGILENSEGVEYWTNGDVKRFNPETLHCELPQTLSNFEGIEPEVMTVTDWFAVSPLTCPIQSYQVCKLPLLFSPEQHMTNIDRLAAYDQTIANMSLDTTPVDRAWFVNELRIERDLFVNC